jgi:hypothetical protein
MSWVDKFTGAIGDIYGGITGGLGDFAKGIFGDDVDLGQLGGLLTTLGYQSGAFDDVLQAAGLDFLLPGGANPPVGYQGGIPEYVAVRERVPQAGIAAPRPGAMGQRYFSDTIYAQKPESMMTPPTLEQAQAQALAQAQGLAGLMPQSPMQGQPGQQPQPRPPVNNNAGTGGGMGTGNTSTGGGFGTGPITDETFYGNPSERPELRAAGGLLGLAKGGFYLGGPTDGMADKVPARIDGRQEARLSDGEFVVPADVVSHLGNGNSNAGAQQLYAMMDKVRQARTGRKEQGKEINPRQYMPGMRV